MMNKECYLYLQLKKEQNKDKVQAVLRLHGFLFNNMIF